MEKTYGKIRVEVDKEVLLQDLQRYEEEAVRLGATRATIVKVEEIPIDERVPMKCQIPLCSSYGMSANCPPHTMKPGALRELLKRYRWAVFFMKDLPTELLLKEVTDKERRAA